MLKGSIASNDVNYDEVTKIRNMKIRAPEEGCSTWKYYATKKRVNIKLANVNLTLTL